MSERVQELKRQIYKKRKLIEQHNNSLWMLQDELISICKHENVEREEEYLRSYYDTVATIVKTVCVDCGTLIEKNTINHGWYG